MPQGARARAAEARRTRGRPRRGAAQPGSPGARRSRGARAPAAETSASQRRGRERELERGSRKGREDAPSEKPPSRARKSPLAAGREGPPRQKPRPCFEEAERESSKGALIKDAKASAARSRQARLEGARQPRGAMVPAAEASASQRKSRRLELERSLHEGREGVRGEKPLSQARRSLPAAGCESPRGRSFSLATKRSKVRAREGLS